MYERFPQDRFKRKKQKNIPINFIKILILIIGIIIMFQILNNIRYSDIKTYFTKTEIEEINKVDMFYKNYELAKIDNYYLGRGFIKGKMYYIFQIKEQNNISNLFIIPEEKTRLYNSKENKITTIKKTTNKTIVNTKTNETTDIDTDILYFEIYLKNTNNIKDYGVISENQKHYFIPFVFLF